MVYFCYSALSASQTNISKRRLLWDKCNITDIAVYLIHSYTVHCTILYYYLVKTCSNQVCLILQINMYDPPFWQFSSQFYRFASKLRKGEKLGSELKLPAPWVNLQVFKGVVSASKFSWLSANVISTIILLFSLAYLTLFLRLINIIQVTSPY